MEFNKVIKIQEGKIDLTQEFDKLNEELKNKLSSYENIVVTIEDKTTYKKDLADIRKMKTEFENGRKELKKAFEQPYKQFEVQYKEKILAPLDEVIEQMDSQIKEIENQEKELIENELVIYFKEVNKYNWIAFHDLGLKIGLSSKVSTLKVDIDNFIARIDSDVKAIESLEDSEVILFEYTRNGFDFGKAIQYNQARKQVAKEEAKEEVKEEVIEVEEIKEDLVTSTFKVECTLSQLKELKQYIIGKGIKIL